LPKPDLEIFLTCAQHFDTTPVDCVGFEDSQAGIKAIKAAGMFAVGIHVRGSIIQTLQYPIRGSLMCKKSCKLEVIHILNSTKTQEMK
jgi:beta-phosphoglucomutase-like phosphatase (HAD superfamily)